MCVAFLEIVWLCGATVARLTPDQKVACSNHVGVKTFYDKTNSTVGKWGMLCTVYGWYAKQADCWWQRPLNDDRLEERASWKKCDEGQRQEHTISERWCGPGKWVGTDPPPPLLFRPLYKISAKPLKSFIYLLGKEYYILCVCTVWSFTAYPQRNCSEPHFLGWRRHSI